MEIKNQEKYVDIIKTLLATVVLGYLAFSFTPLVLIIYPMFLMESSIRNGLVITMAVAFAAALITSLFTTLMSGLSLFFIFGPMILAFHYGVFNRKNFIFVFFLMFLALSISFISLELGLARLNPFNISDFSNELITMQLENFGSSMSNLELANLEKTLKMVNEIVITILPSIYMVIIAFICYINYTSVGRRLIFKGILINQPPIFGNLQMPKILILGLGLGILASLALRVLGFEIYRTIYLNVLVVFGFLFLVNGLALGSNIFMRLRTPNFFRILFYWIAIIITPVSLVVIFAGFIDTLINFRSYTYKKGVIFWEDLNI